MELNQAMIERRSVRQYLDKPVPAELVDQLMEAARIAPSGSNLQPIRYLVIESAAVKDQLADAIPQPFITKAPLLLACVGDKKLFERLSEAERKTPYNQMRLSWDEKTLQGYLYLNAGISLEHVVLRAVDLGLGSCWVRQFDGEKIAQILELDERYDLIALLPVGYPAKQPAMRPRVPLAEMVIKKY